MTPFTDPRLEARFDAYPAKARRRMLALRELLWQSAASTPEIGDIEETLKWGEPAYRCKDGKGSTVRMDWKAKAPDTYAMYFHCQTTLVHTFRTMFPRDFTFSGNRALVFRLNEDVPTDALKVCIVAALTYRRKRCE